MTKAAVAKNWGALHTWADGSHRSYPESQQQQTAFGTFAAGLSSGDYTEYEPQTSFAFTDVNYGGGSVGSWCTKGVYDVANQCLEFTGSSHQGADLRLLRFDEATDVCAVIANDCWFDDIAAHGYHNFALDPATSDKYFRRGNFQGTAYRWPGTDRSNKAAVVSIAAPETPTSDAGAMEWFPGRGKCVYWDLWVGIWEYDPVADAFSELVDETSVPNWDGEGSYYTWACYVPAEQAVYLGNETKVYRLAADGSLTQRANAPVTLGPDYHAAVCPDWSETDTLVAYSIDGNEYRYKESTNTWRTVGTHPFANGVNQEYVVVPVSAYGVNVALLTLGADPPILSAHKP